MSLFGSFLHDFDDDQFFGFSSMSNTMGDINSMINSMVSSHCNMFGGMDMMGRRGRQNQLMPFGFPNMNDIFESFQFNTNDPNGHSFSSSTFMTMSSGPDGRPQVYQASQSTRTAPGGIRETKKSVCDSRTGTKKMAIGHHIGDRSHVMEREQNIHSGREEERQEFINLDEEEAEEFNREWETKTRASMNAISYGGSNHRSHSRRPRDDLPAIQDRFEKMKLSESNQSGLGKGAKAQRKRNKS
ncbi:UNVERIFIED_CONTAM: hypothetical protein PYX00_003076 [Menopon gallinae]|uniref:Myeloid leukemia factor n=1 Tax=Menopon gallinae TaxID=328185 RepID=A0AAW2HYQ9_9NEOP